MGSGAIALAIANEQNSLAVTATDNCPAALDVAKANAGQNGIENIKFIQSNWFDGLPRQQYDLIVSNPPYIACDDIHLTQGDVRFEPREALVSGVEGLKDLKTIINQAKSYLKQKGWLLVEHGYDQEKAVRILFEQQAYKNIKNHKDLNGQPRVMVGQKIN